MAAVAPSSDQTADMLQKVTLDSKPKTENAKKPSVDSGNLANGQPDKSMTPLLQDPNTGFWYPSAYYYSGYDASGTDSEAYKRYMHSDGVEMNQGVYGENGSLIYPHGYGYSLYAPYSPATSPVPTSLGQDGQTYGAQHYQYPSMYYPSLPTGPYSNPALPAKGEKTASVDHKPVSTDSKSSNSNVIANGGSAKGINATVPGRYPYQNSSFGMNGSNGRGGVFDGLQTPYSWYESPYFSDAYSMPLTSSPMNSSGTTGNGVLSSRSRNQNFQPHNTGLHHPRPLPVMNNVSGYMNGMYSNKYYGPFGYDLGYGSNYSSRMYGRNWMSVDGKYKPRGRGNAFYGNENLDGLNELNRGPRGNSKNPKAFAPVALAVKGQNIPLTVTSDVEKLNLSATLDRDQFNKPDFPETCTEAKCFIIKSYSEDDVHKSIKYNVWSSTPNGNKKLDAAYLEAQQKSDGCPVFLFFSVNTSGQFVGVAEMVGPVDFEKNVEYWQQDKWVGCFPVKWHIVKDLPNSMLKHIILEYNENKPVTNSRDTQEVKSAQGLEMLKIFKDYTSKLCILDDFEFYEDRQKRIQEKKAKQQLYQKQAQQVLEGKTKEEKKADGKEDALCDIKARDSSEIASSLEKEVTKLQAEALPENCK